MATTQKFLNGTLATITAAADLNGLANNALVVATNVNPYDNTPGTGSSGTTGDGWPYAYIDLQVGAPAAAFAANTGISIWFLQSVDGGSTYEDGSASLTPSRPPDIVIPLEATATAQHITRVCDIPPCKFKVLIKNDGTGQALAASGNTLRLLPFTNQAV